jgi:predicted RNA-binding protein associated with RNAse of E/G family
MNRDDIIRMAREAGLNWTEKDVPEVHIAFERFATLVAAAEREACAKVCIDAGATKGRSDDGFDMADHCADAIRARGTERG